MHASSYALSLPVDPPYPKTLCCSQTVRL